MIISLKSRALLLSSLFLFSICVADSSVKKEEKEKLIVGKVQFPPEANVIDSQLPQVKVLIDAGEKYTFSRADGSFVLPSLTPGNTYSLELFHPKFHFPPYKLAFSQDETIRLSFNHPKAGMTEQVQKGYKPLLFTPLGGVNYFKPRKEISLLSMLMNPMMLMMGFTMLMVFAMPKLMGNIDPEELKKLQEEQAKQRKDVDPTKMLNGAMASMLGVKQPEDDSDSDDD